MRTLYTTLVSLASTATLLTSPFGFAGSPDRSPAPPAAAVALTAGRCTGPADQYDSVDARATDTYQICFSGYGEARIRVNGDDDTDLDCFVYDANGYQLARDDDDTDYCILNWRSQGRQTVELRIRNLGDVYNRYRLWTN